MARSVSMSRVVLAREFMNDLLLAVRPASATEHLLVAPKIALIGPNELSFSPDLTLAALEAAEVEFSGYTAGGAAVTLGAVPVRSGDRVMALAGNVSWVAPVADPFVEGEIVGWYMTDDTYGLVCFESFEESVLIAHPGDYFDLFAGLALKLNTLGL